MCLTRVGKVQHRQLVAIGVDLENGKVRPLVIQDQLSRVFPPVAQHDAEGVGPFHDMIVGHNHAVFTDDHTGTERVLHAALRRCASIQKHLHRRDARLYRFLRVDVHHGGRDFLHQWRKGQLDFRTCLRQSLGVGHQG